MITNQHSTRSPIHTPHASHFGHALQVSDLPLQGVDVPESLGLGPLLGLQGAVAAAWIQGLQQEQLVLELTPSLLAALQEGAHVGPAQQLLALLVLQALDVLPPSGREDPRTGTVTCTRQWMTM